MVDVTDAINEAGSARYLQANPNLDAHWIPRRAKWWCAWLMKCGSSSLRSAPPSL